MSTDPQEPSNLSVADENEESANDHQVEIKSSPNQPMDAPDPTGETEDQPCAEYTVEQRVEALLLSSERPLGEGKLAEMLGLSGKQAAKSVREAIKSLNQAYQETGRSFRIDRLAGGWRVLTLSAYGPLLVRLHAVRQSAKLSQSALETLSIIAYRQPLMRAEIEAIRGVGCGEVLRGLMERRLVKITGRAEEIGRPMLYGTTKEFLKVFGLSGLDDLPAVEGLERVRRPSRAATGSGSSEEPEKVVTTDSE